MTATMRNVKSAIQFSTSAIDSVKMGRSEEHTSELQSLNNLYAVFCLRSEEHTSELQSLTNLVCRLLLEKKNKKISEDLSCLNQTLTNMCHTQTLSTRTDVHLHLFQSFC